MLEDENCFKKKKKVEQGKRNISLGRGERLQF